MTGSAGVVYGARRTVSLNILKTGGKVRKGGDTKVGADGRWADLEKVWLFRIMFGMIFGIVLGHIFGLILHHFDTPKTIPKCVQHVIF